MSHWLCDDSGKLEAQANVVSTSSVEKVSTKLNALWAEGEGLSSKKEKVQYFELLIDQGDQGVWFGFGNKERFGSGWKCKALNYGGNLSDGGGLMRSKFGPSPRTGDIIGLRGEIDDSGTLHVYFSHNGVPLGKGFEITNCDSYGAFYPVVCFNSGPGKARIIRKSPESSGPMEKPDEGPRTSEEGSWSLDPKILDTDYEANHLHEVVKVVFEVQKGEEQWQVSARVANSINGRVSAKKPHVSTGQVMSTKMMPPPELAKVEASVVNLMESISDVDLMSSGQLCIKSEGKEYVLNAHSETHKPVARNELNWR